MALKANVLLGEKVIISLYAKNRCEINSHFIAVKDMSMDVLDYSNNRLNRSNVSLPPPFFFYFDIRF